jgi:hypothetical protein
MSQWQNPPYPGFSVDPTVAPKLRPSASDRDYADTTLRLAHADGRLTRTELAERVERADSATSLGELNDLIADVTPPSAVGPDSRLLPVESSPPPIVPALAPERRSAPQLVLARSIVSWLALALLFNVIWLFSSGLGSYYWPIWPMLGTAMPLIGLLAARVGPAPVRPPRVEPPTDLR